MDPAYCVRTLAAVNHIPLNVSTEMLDVGGKHWKVLLAAAQFAFEHAYSKPYGASKGYGDDLPVKCDDGTLVQRPNHSLVHAIRQAWYAPFVLKYLSQSQVLEGGESRWAFDACTVLRVQLRLIFEASGRKTDYGWGSKFSAASAQLRKRFLQTQIDGSVELQEPIPDEPAVQDVYKTSNYRKMMLALQSDEESQIDRGHEVFSKIKDVVEAYCNTNGISIGSLRFKEYDGPQALKKYGTAVHDEVFKSIEDLNKELLHDVGAICARLYSATTKLQIDEQSSSREMCFFMNHALRSDDHACLTSVLPIVHRLNQHITTELRKSQQHEDLPPEMSLLRDGYHVSYRGGGMKDEYKDFFRIGMKYRSNQYISTSFQREKTMFFLRRQKSGEPILWRIHTSPMCVNVKYMQKTTVSEDEFLFVPHSIFTVLAVKWSSSPLDVPHEIDVQVCTDNKEEVGQFPHAPRC